MILKRTNRLRQTLIPAILSLGFLVNAALLCQSPGEWSQFRGPNGSGIARTDHLPSQFGPGANLVWKTPLPPGHSSPILGDGRVFLTAFEGDKLLTICISSENGEVLWRKLAPRSRSEKLDNRNSPTSPSPVVGENRVFVFFPDFGVLAYDFEGNEIWRHPLEKFNNIYGMGASPILVDDKVILVCDQSTNSYILALARSDGRMIWKTPRPEARSGHSTPIVYKAPDGGTQIVVPGSFLLTGYEANSGKRVWWVRGLSFEIKSTPVVRGDVLFINGYGSPMNQPGKQVEVPEFSEAATQFDADRNGRLNQDEVTEGPGKSWFGFVDLAGDGELDGEDWNYLRAAMASLNGMLAIRMGGRGDMTDESLLWQYRRAVPQLPSPLLYKDVLYMVNDGGIVTSFVPETGKVIKRGRLREAVDNYYASPVAGDDKVYMLSLGGRLSVLRADGSLDVITVSDLGEQCYATPAIDRGRMYVRTEAALYCFAE